MPHYHEVLDEKTSYLMVSLLRSVIDHGTGYPARQKFGFEAAPLALAFVLGPMLETALRESLQMSGGSFSILFTRPISGSCMVLVAGLLVLQTFSIVRSRKKEK